MKLSILLTFVSALIYTTLAFEIEEYEKRSLFKREHGLPFSTLPSTNCSVPSTCSSVTGSVTCRCSDTITTCTNSKDEYCWGSISLNQTSCPSVPTSCTSTLTGSTTKCLCDNKNILCVDNVNNYCYSAIVAGSAVLTPLPYAPSASGAVSSAAPSAASSAGGSSKASGTSNTKAEGMSVKAAPSVETTETATSGSNSLSITIFSTLVTILIALTIIN